MKILLVYPHYPATFWSFRYAMKFIDRKASFPPLGLMTVAAMLPDAWHKRLVDMNVQPLTEQDLQWADYVFISAMNIQCGRGCPHDCKFCDITSLFGHQPRSKPLARLLAELESLYIRDWRGAVFFVDDNFIGDKPRLKREILPALIAWMKAREYPFYFYTEASIDLADDPRLMELMVDAGFEEVFIGIETPHEAAFAESGKMQNKNRDLLASVKGIQQAGLQVHGGFIAGYQSILDNIDAPQQFYQRVTRLFREYRPRPQGRFHLQQGHIGALFKSMLLLGVFGRERVHFWKLLFWSLLRKPRLLPLAITYAVYGFHFRRVAEKIRASGKFKAGGWEQKDSQTV